MQGMSGNIEYSKTIGIFKSEKTGPMLCASLSTVTCRVQNPGIPWAGRVGAHGGVAGRGRAAQDAKIIVRLGDERPSHPPRGRRYVA